MMNEKLNLFTPPLGSYAAVNLSAPCHDKKNVRIEGPPAERRILMMDLLTYTSITNLIERNSNNFQFIESQVDPGQLLEN